MSATNTHHDLKKFRGHTDQWRSGTTMTETTPPMNTTAQSSLGGFQHADMVCVHVSTPSEKQSSPVSANNRFKLN